MSGSTERLEQARVALAEAQPNEALRVCQADLECRGDNAEARYLGGEALHDLGELQPAHDWFTCALELDPCFSAAWSARGMVHFDQLTFEAATHDVNQAIRADDGNAAAYYLRAMLRERRSDMNGAQRDYNRAVLLDSDQFPRPVPLDDSTVEAVVAEVLALLGPAVGSALERVVILLHEVPDTAICASFDPPAAPGDLLGLFQGTVLGESMGVDTLTALPPSILLFRCNLQRIAWDHEHLIEELRITLFHEIGHFLGLDEAEVAARGLG